MKIENLVDLLFSKNGKHKMSFIQLMEYFAEKGISYQDVKANKILFEYFVEEFTNYCCKSIMQRNIKCIRMRNMLTPLRNTTPEIKGLRADDIGNMQEAASEIFIKLDRKGFEPIFAKPKLDIYRYLSLCCYRELVTLVRKDSKFYDKTQAEISKEIKKVTTAKGSDVDELTDDITSVDKDKEVELPSESEVNALGGRGVIVISEIDSKNGEKTPIFDPVSLDASPEEEAEKSEELELLRKNVNVLNTIEAIAVVANMLCFKDKPLAEKLMVISEYDILNGLLIFGNKYNLFEKYGITLEAKDFSYAFSKASKDSKQYADKSLDDMRSKIRHARSSARQKIKKLGIAVELIDL